MTASGIRIGLVGPLPPPSGGMANQTLQLARLLEEEGGKVEVVQVNRPYRPSCIANLKGVRALFRFIPYLVTLWRVAGRVDVFHVMANSGWSWHLFAAPAIWIGRLRGIGVVVNYRGGEAGGFLQSSIRTVRPSLARVQAIIVPSGFLKSVFARHHVETEIVPNIIDLARFSPDRRTTEPNRGPHVLVARNLEPIYDNATALRAFRLVKNVLPNARMTIAGSGPERAMLESLAEALQLDECTAFTGRVDNADMAALYASADVMVNPSLADNMPNSVLEAMASGVPVVSTDVGGVPFLVEHDKTALLVPPQQPEQMAAAILAVLTNSAKAEQLRNAGVEAASAYTWPKVRPLLLAVYRRAMQGPAPLTVEGR